MIAVPAFNGGLTPLSASPILLVAGLLAGVGSQLQYVDHLIKSPLLSAGTPLVWLLVFPFVLGGFIGTTRAATDGTDASLIGFLTAVRTHYLRVFLVTVLFVLLVFGTTIGLGIVGFVLGIGTMALGVINQMAAFVAGVISMPVWLVSIFVVLIFVRFCDTAIVIENKSVTDAFRRSIGFVRSNLKSVVGFSLAWLALLSIFFVPEYLLQLTLTDAAPTDVLPIDPGIRTAVLLPIGIVLSAVGFAYFYTVYTAYYTRLIGISPADPEATETPTNNYER